MTSGRSEEAGVAVRPPAPAGWDQGPPEHEDAPEAADPHHTLVESLVDVLDATPEQVEELLAVLHEELGEGGTLDAGVLDAFERGLQLGLMVGVGARELAGPGTEGRTGGSAPPNR
jgi:hypothetical protein